MQIILIIISIILVILAAIIPAVYMIELIDKVKWYHYIVAFLFVIIMGIGAGAVADKASEINKPKAIDVYNSKTTLQITYVDSIPQDTIVIFKERTPKCQNKDKLVSVK